MKENIQPSDISMEEEFSAFYPGKEACKNKPGNRYTAEELEKMEENWEITISDPP